MRYLLGFIFATIFLGCARDAPLVNNKQDLQKYVKPYKKILLFAQGCSENKDLAKSKALTNFSLKIYSNIESSFNKNETLYNNQIEKKATYKIFQKSVYNDLFGLNYYIEEPYEKNNKKIYCVDVYVDFHYFSSFEEGFKNQILNLDYIIDNMDINNYKEQGKLFNKKMEKLLSYLWIYKSWALQNFYNDKSQYLQNSLEQLKKRKKSKVEEFKKKELKLLKTEFQELLDEHKIVENKKKKLEIISKLMNIKERAKLLEIDLETEDNYFDKFDVEQLKQMIKIKPLCSFTFQANRFLQWKKYLIINNSYKKDCDCDINCKFNSAKNVRILKKDDNYYIIPKSAGYHWIKLEVDANGIKEVCKKRIYVIPHDPRLDRLKIGMNIKSFKKKMKHYFKKIVQIYPEPIKESNDIWENGLNFLKKIKNKTQEILFDKTNVYKFGRYYAVFKENSLKCVIKKNFYVENKNDCNDYNIKMLVKLD